MKVIKASEVDPNSKDWLCQFSTEELLLIRQFLGTMGQSSPLFSLSNSIRTKLMEKGFTYVAVFSTADIKFRTDSLENIQQRAASMNGEVNEHV